MNTQEPTYEFIEVKNVKNIDYDNGELISFNDIID